MKLIGISGSRSGAILGLSKYKTEFSVWLDIMESMKPGFCEDNGYIKDEFKGNTATRFGNAFEDEVLKATEINYQKEITDQQHLFKKDFMSCHVDGVMGEYLIEAKTTSYFSFKDSFGEPGTDRIPPEYGTQVQHNMMVSGLDKCIMPVLVFPKRQAEYEAEGIGVDNDFSMIDIKKWVEVLVEMGSLKYYEIDANPRLQQMMLRAYQEWWTRYIDGCTPPEPENYDDIIRMCSAPVGTIICHDEDLNNRKTSVYKSINSDIKQMNQDRADIRLDVLNYARNNTHQTVQTCPVDRHLTQSRCVGQCELDRCVVGDMVSAIDENSKDKWLILTPDGKKVATLTKKNDKFIFR